MGDVLPLMCSLPLPLYASSSSPSPLLSFLKSCLSTLQLLITFNFNFGLYLSFVSFYFSLLLCFSLCLHLWPLFLFHCLPLSLSELSVQTVEYMLSKYTSPLSLRLNKLQQGERKREAVGQEEGRMGTQRGDEA